MGFVCDAVYTVGRLVKEWLPAQVCSASRRLAAAAATEKVPELPNRR